MIAPEAYIHYSPKVFTQDGEVTGESTREFLTNSLADNDGHVVRVLTVPPRQ